MKRLAALVCFLVSIPLLADDSPLKGARTIFVNPGAVSVKRDIQLALRHELPQVRVVSHAKDADVIVDITGIFSGVNNGVNLAVQPATNGSASTNSEIGGVDSSRMRAPNETVTYNPGHAVATVRRGTGAALVIHEGIPTDSFANQFAARFITAWRAANNS